MKPINKIFAVFSLLALFTMTITSSALAFDGRGGETVTIGADEIVEDDVYVGATNFTLEGTIKGDLFVSGETIVINGTVEGDLFAMGQSIVINGTVTDDVRIAGAGLQTAAIEAVSKRIAGTAAGLFSTSRYCGSILGSSVWSGLIGAQSDQFNVVFGMVLVAALLSLVASFVMQPKLV